MSAILRFAAGLALLALGCTSASAETLYRSTDVSGHVVYSDRPLPGTAKIEVVSIEPLDPERAARAAAEREKLRQQAQAFQQRELARERALDQAHADVIASIDALKEAERRREAGVEPLPGERLGNARGASRLAPSYFARLQALDRDLDLAQQRLDEAYALQNELR